MICYTQTIIFGQVQPLKNKGLKSSFFVCYYWQTPSQCIHSTQTKSLQKCTWHQTIMTILYISKNRRQWLKPKIMYFLILISQVLYYIFISSFTKNKNFKRKFFPSISKSLYHFYKCIKSLFLIQPSKVQKSQFLHELTNNIKFS